MIVDSDLREVNFEKYCIICKHAECPEHEDPCFECLDNPLNYCTEKPVKWEEKERNLSMHGIGNVMGHIAI